MSMRRCVSYCLLITVLLITAPAQAQQPKKVRRIGYLGNTSSTSAIDMKVFRERLNELAYIEGQNIFIEWRFAEDKSDRYADFAADLVRLKLDVMVAANAAAVGALKRATQTIAIVMESYGGDPLADGIVASFAKPGGNITGMTPLDPELSGKQLELLKETLGKLHLLAVLWNPNDSGSRVQWQQAQTAAKDVAIQLTSLEVRTAGELERAVESATRESAAALLVLRNALFYVLRNRIVTLAERNRLPGMYPSSEFVEGGGLMSYGANNDAQYHRAATFVDKILKGAKPGSLPLEAPRNFELVINLKTAKQIGVTIPPSVLYRADRVIK